MGFDEIIPYGSGMVLLFFGASGTGKTMMVNTIFIFIFLLLFIYCYVYWFYRQTVWQIICKKKFCWLISPPLVACLLAKTSNSFLGIKQRDRRLYFHLLILFVGRQKLTTRFSFLMSVRAYSRVGKTKTTM